MNWYEVAKYRSSGILWGGTIQVSLTSLRTRESTRVREERILKENRGGVVLWVLSLDGNNGDDLRLPASCLCLSALHIQLPATFVLWQRLLHTCTVGPFTLHWWNIFLEITDSSMPSCCLLPWKYTFSRLTVKFLETFLRNGKWWHSSLLFRCQ